MRVVLKDTLLYNQPAEQCFHLRGATVWPPCSILQDGYRTKRFTSISQLVNNIEIFISTAKPPILKQTNLTYETQYARFDHKLD